VLISSYLIKKMDKKVNGYNRDSSNHKNKR